ncbi:MAG: murein hydrolase activator EnvC family protein [Thermoleophilia bacterium]
MRWKPFICGALLFLLLYPATTAIAACLSGTTAAPPDLRWPAPGAVVNGWSLDCATGRGHRGIDIATTGGEQVRAAGAGTVAFTGYTPAEGGSLTVAISHEGGVRSTYLQLEAISVAAGQQVVAGDPVGTSNGQPLHFGLKLPGASDRYLNPLDYLPAPAGSGLQPIEPVAVTETLPPPAGELPSSAVTVTVAAEVPAGVAVPSPRPDDMQQPVTSTVAAVAPGQAPAPVVTRQAPSSPILGKPSTYGSLMAVSGNGTITSRGNTAPPLSAALVTGPGSASGRSKPAGGYLSAIMGLILVALTAVAGRSFAGGRQEPAPRHGAAFAPVLE